MGSEIDLSEGTFSYEPAESIVANAFEIGGGELGEEGLVRGRELTFGSASVVLDESVDLPNRVSPYSCAAAGRTRSAYAPVAWDGDGVSRSLPRRQASALGLFEWQEVQHC